MPHCDSFYRALDKKLEQKMTIDEMATDLCSKTKDPRRNMILDIKEHKGEDWLVTNAEWLGYRIDKAVGGLAKANTDKVNAAMGCSMVNIAPLSKVSITHVVPETTVSDKVVKDSPKVEKIVTIPPKVEVTNDQENKKDVYIIKGNEEEKRDEITAKLISVPYEVDDNFFIDVRLELNEKLWIYIERELHAKYESDENFNIDLDLECLKGKSIKLIFKDGIDIRFTS